MFKLLMLTLIVFILKISTFAVRCDSPMLWLHAVQPNLTAGNVGFFNFTSFSKVGFLLIYQYYF